MLKNIILLKFSNSIKENYRIEYFLQLQFFFEYFPFDLCYIRKYYRQKFAIYQTEVHLIHILASECNKL